MCLTIPGKIKKIEDGIAYVESDQRSAKVDIGLLPKAKAGDWILYATDRAVRVISKNDAQEILTLLEEHYRPVNANRLPQRLKEIILKVKGGNHKLSKPEIEYMLSIENENELETLFAEANSLRKEMIADFVCIHGIIEFSNYCKNLCLYCGIRNGGRKIKRYRMGEDEILRAVKEAVEEGYKLIVLQSGEDEGYSDKELVKIIKKIRKNYKVFIFISVGERSKDFYKKAFAAGASGSLFRFETSNPNLYKKMRPMHSLESRIKNLEYQKKLGYYIASGSLIGLPGQSISDIAEDLLMIKKLGIPMISSGPYIQAANTPLSKQNIEYRIPNIENESGKLIANSWKLKAETSLKLTLKYIAVARFMMPKIKIPVTTALETLDPKEGRHKGLLAGANALMFNLTPKKYCKNYRLYDNKYLEREKVWQKYGLFKGEESWEMLEKRLRDKL